MTVECGDSGQEDLHRNKGVKMDNFPGFSEM